MSHSAYRSGVCNIGSKDRRTRRLFGYASLGLAILYVAAMVELSLPAIHLVGVALLLYGGAIGLVQDRARFCVALGMLGRYSFDDESGSIEDAAERSRDRTRSVKLVAIAVAIAVVATAAVYGALSAL